MDDLVAVTHRPDPATLAAVDALRAAARAADGWEPLSEHQQMELHRVAHLGDGAVEAPGATAFAAVLARRPGHDDLTGYAQVSGAGSGDLAIELVVHPDHRTPDRRVAAHLLGEALAEADRLAGPTGGTVRLWVAHADEADDALAAEGGLRVERTLLVLRRPLPLEGPPADLPTRAFVVGRDEEAWLVQNNRSFAGHPEQGGWTRATLEEREREPWFDPDGFRLYEEDGRLAASCWTKVHADTDPPAGEIYVISVDPDFGGRGLGRAVTAAGLAWLAAAGLSVAILYVDDANHAAVALYRSMGFTEDHADRAYARPAGRPAPG